jgi:cytochrome c biogenesis protein CcdA
MPLVLSLPQVGLSLAAGSLSTLSPCVFALWPLVLGGAMQGSRYATVVMGVGMTASFAGIGMLLGALGTARPRPRAGVGVAALGATVRRIPWAWAGRRTW